MIVNAVIAVSSVRVSDQLAGLEGEEDIYMGEGTRTARGQHQALC
jgi:hypothetical protein